MTHLEFPETEQSPVRQSTMRMSGSSQLAGFSRIWNPFDDREEEGNETY
jgi:hypothetical protein